MDTASDRAPPAGWLEALARSEAELQAGLVVSGDEVMRELEDSIARMEAKKARKSSDEAIIHR